MKNIYVLPTNKPSRVFNTNKGEYHFREHYVPDTIQTCKNHNIYITSDEEIKEGDWVITPTNDILEWAKVFQPIGKKIILTTDQDLIKYGVQPIDDEFLKWFVENESCETVEIDRDEREVGNHLGGVVTEYGDYKIIIPEKEKLIIEIPKGYMNTGVSICNHFIADTNDSSNWDTIKFPLPQGKWSIRSVEGKIVTLVRTI